MNQHSEKIIVALDYESPEKAFQLVETLGDAIQWYKVGSILFTRSGTETIRFLHSAGKKIFVDLKLHDTPYVVSQTVTQLVEMGVQMATVHCLGGRDMIDAASRSCRGSRLKLLGISLLTSHSAADYKALGWEDGKDAQVMDHLIDLAHNARMAGIVCSPHEIKRVAARTLPGFTKVVAGIRIPEKEVFEDDQKRVASPSEALEWGADYLVIGRPITFAREPLEVVSRLFE